MSYFNSVSLVSGSTVAHIDSEVKFLCVDSPLHCKVHCGDFYVATDIDGDVDSGSPKLWLLQCPAAVEVHARIGVSASDEIVVKFYENPIVSSSGSNALVRNYNRESTNTGSTGLFMSNPTVSSNGDILFVELVGSSAKKSNVGGSSNNFAEWVGKPDTAYLVEVAATNDNTKASIQISFYLIDE
jgi:hypothetical protein